MARAGSSKGLARIDFRPFIIPDAEVLTSHEGSSYRPQKLIRLARGAVLQKALQVSEVSVHAWALRYHLCITIYVATKLMIDDRSEISYLVAPARCFNKLLCPECNQHTDNDDTYFTKQSAPALHWLGQMEMHTGPRSLLWLTEALMSAMGGKLTLGFLANLVGLAEKLIDANTRVAARYCFEGAAGWGLPMLLRTTIQVIALVLSLSLTIPAGAKAAATAIALDVPAVKQAVDHVLDIEYPHLDALYKDIHSHPELSFQETRTAALLAKEMRSLGFDVTEHVGKTGLVAIYRNGPGPTVMVRTELDALPMEEKTGLPYASRARAMWNGKETFVAHSCGHDIHMAAWVGTARALLAMKDRWRGSLMFIAQPSEESVGAPAKPSEVGVSGAVAMLKDGLFTRFAKPDLGFALHDGPAAYGEVSYISGAYSSNADNLDIVFKGRGGHGSIPSATIDPILIAARFVVDVQSVISREKDAGAFGVVTIGAIEGGSAGNIIPDQVRVRGTIRSYDAGVRAKLLAGVERTAKAEAMMAGAPAPEVSLEARGKAVVNDPPLTERTAAVFKAAFGERAVRMSAPIPNSDDYSEYIIAGVPSVFFNIGALDPAQVAAAKAGGGPPVPVNHSPFFAPVPEPTIRTGVEAMTFAVMNVMPPR